MILLLLNKNNQREERQKKLYIYIYYIWHQFISILLIINVCKQNNNNLCVRSCVQNNKSRH